jgi:hypothetical protein
MLCRKITIIIKIKIHASLAPYSMQTSLLVFWPHSVFGQNHLYLRMLQTGIPLFRVKSEEFQSSLSAVRRIVPSRPDAYCSYFFRLDDVPSRPDTVSPASSIWTMCFFRPDTYTVSRSFCASLLRPDVLADRPDAYLRKARIAVQNEPSRHLTAVVRTLVHRIW